MNASIAVVGSLNMDLVVYTPRHPGIGETILGEKFLANPGGKGANQAVAASRLGATVTMIGKVGADPFGAELLASLNSNGVKTEGVLCDPSISSGVALITINAAGDNSIVVVPGGNMNLYPKDIERSEKILDQVDMLLLQLEIPLATNLCAARLAKAHGAKIVLNPAPARALPSDLLNLIDILVLNESEAALLSGLVLDSRENLIQAARKLKKTMSGELIVTLGDQGSMWIGEADYRHFPAYPVEVVDTTAAGDAFIGGLAVALLENRSIFDAIRLGNAAGALTVTQNGAHSSLPNRQDCELLLKTYSRRDTQI